LQLPLRNPQLRGGLQDCSLPCCRQRLGPADGGARGGDICGRAVIGGNVGVQRLRGRVTFMRQRQRPALRLLRYGLCRDCGI
jgi:hypothetical protein